MTEVKWVFTGSNIYKDKENNNVYEADKEGTVIATWHCAAAVIDNPLPEGSDDTVFYSHEKNMPERGTKVTFIFSPEPLEFQKKQQEKPENNKK